MFVDLYFSFKSDINSNITTIYDDLQSLYHEFHESYKNTIENVLSQSINQHQTSTLENALGIKIYIYFFKTTISFLTSYIFSINSKTSNS